MNGPPIPLFLALCAAIALAYSAWAESPERRSARLERALAGIEAEQHERAAVLERERARCVAIEQTRPADAAACFEYVAERRALHADYAEHDTVQAEAIRSQLRALR